MLRVHTGGLVRYARSAWNFYSHSKLPEGKQGFAVNHTVWTNSSGTGSHAYHLGKVLYQCRELFTVMLPDVSQGSTSRASLSQAVLGLCNK